VVLLKLMGARPVLVHGGGKALSRAMELRQIPVEFKDGLRVTTPEAMEVVREVLAGSVNTKLVMAVNAHGALAVGTCGVDANTLVGSPVSPDYGRVGTVEKVNVEYLRSILDAERIPVLSSIASDGQGGSLNVNADVVAGEVAAAMGAHKIVFLTDVDGIYEDFDDKSTLISNMTLEEARDLVNSGVLSTGMIPKVKSCIRALDAGVYRTHVINGTTHHALLLELLTDSGIGTVIHRTQEAYQFENHPLGPVASKLIENLEQRDQAAEEE
jgi:acetylglutamate kinase